MKKELDLLVKLQAFEYQKMVQQPDKTKGWLASGNYQLNPDLDPNWLAANTVVASAIMNSDASITKR